MHCPSESISSFKFLKLLMRDREFQKWRTPKTGPNILSIMASKKKPLTFGSSHKDMVLVSFIPT